MRAGVPGEGGAAWVCPDCLGDLDDERSRLRCGDCGAVYGVDGGIPDFVRDDELTGSSAFYEAVFDRAAEIYESPLWYPLGLRLGGGLGVDDLADWLVDRVPRGSVVLDAPTGTGLFARRLADPAATVHGVDVAEGMLRRAQRGLRRDGVATVALARARVERLPAADRRFDVAVCTGALYLFDDPVEALDELGRVLAIDGRLLAMTIVDGGPLASRAVRRGYERVTGVDVATEDAVAGWLDDAGFAPEETWRSGAVYCLRASRR